MAIEIREIIIKAMTGMEEKKDKEKNSSCDDEKKTQTTQETVNAVSEILKNEKER